MMLLLLEPQHGPFGSPWVLILVPVVFLCATWLTNKLLGIDAMYQDWPAVSDDPIERNLGWQQVEFGTFRGHCPISIKFGRRCLHLKQPFPFQPVWWRGPASIPWDEVLLVKEPNPSWWAFLSAAEFCLGAGGRMIRLRGKAAQILMLRIQPPQTLRQGPGPIPPVVGPGAIKPR